MKRMMIRLVFACALATALVGSVGMVPAVAAGADRFCDDLTGDTILTCQDDVYPITKGASCIATHATTDNNGGSHFTFLVEIHAQAVGPDGTNYILNVSDNSEENFKGCPDELTLERTGLITQQGSGVID